MNIGHRQTDLRPMVLLVEDDESNLRALVASLDDPGYVIVTATSGEAALRQVLAHDFAVILLDVKLPGLDGFETAQIIRRRHRSYKTPIIFLTGALPDSTHMFRGYQAGAVDYMLKPIIPEVLKFKVRVFVDLYSKTARIEAQNIELEALAQRSEQRFYDLVQNLDAIVWEALPDHRFTFVSQRAQTILGFPVSKWLTSARFFEQLVYPDDLPVVRAAYRRISGGDSGTIVEYRVRRADYQVIWMRDHVHVSRDSAGNCRQLRGVMVDVTAQKDIEHRLQQQAHQLLESDRHRNEFLAMLGHELRNPLAPIQSAVEWLRLQSGEDRTDIGWGIDTIARQAGYMGRLVDDLLDVARITRGKIELQRCRTDLVEIVSRSVDTMRPLIRSKDHELDVTLAEGSLPIDGDAVRLTQIVANLLHNAAKYTDPGGHIRLALQRDGNEAVIRIGDDGIGIPEDMLGRIFDLFTQAPATGHQASGGLGVGLTLVRSLVEMHGGYIAAHSDGVGCGSEFIVRLPLQLDNVINEPVVPVSEHPVTGSRGQRILVVDDNEDAAWSLAMLLRALGHEVQPAGDGPAALACVSAFCPDVVFLDIGLPGMNGYEVARKLRHMHNGRQPTLIALTGYNRGSAHASGEDALFDHFLLKPSDLSTVRKILEAAPPVT